MNNINIYKIDGKLLSTFKIVFDQGSVTQAAVQLGVTQSTVSHALDRLRGIFDDPLFVRAGRKIAPTERAISLEPLISEILEQLNCLTEAVEIDIPKISTRFILSANDFERSLFAQTLASRLLKQAPNSSLKLIDTKGDVVNSLRSRECDLVVTPLNPINSYDLHTQHLFDDSFACFYDQNHISANRIKKEYGKLRHATVNYSKGEPSIIDDFLENTNITRDIAIEAPSIEALPYLIRNTPIIATLPFRIKQSLLKNFNFCNTPFRSPNIQFQLVWHRTTHHSREYHWFRSLVKQSFNTRTSP